MPLPPRPALLDETLRIVARRYRVPATPEAPTRPQAPQQAEAPGEARPASRNGHGATTLAIAIDEARQALARGQTPGPTVRQAFIAALARLIEDAMRDGQGDPAIQAMELRHRAAPVREYASLSTGADADRREILAAANAMAHPAKQQRMALGPQRDMLADVHATAASGDWTALALRVQQLRALPESIEDEAIARSAARLLDSLALLRLQRLDILAADPLVRHYQSLWDRNGPRPGTATALRQGSDAQQRGAAVEALATQALQALAQRLNDTKDRAAPYRVVTSMRVPASLPANADRAKSEWDAALLQRADTADAWDVLLLVEAKASVDAASTDLPRLLRGLQLLAHADAHIVYPFKTQQGVVPLRGASLRALPTGGAQLASAVLYCCDAPADPAARLLNAASRMQLLSAPASIAFASRLAQHQPADPESLAPVWQLLLSSPQWAGVLNQYPQLHQVRALMVHTDDLLAAARTALP